MPTPSTSTRRRRTVGLALLGGSILAGTVVATTAVAAGGHPAPHTAPTPPNAVPGTGGVVSARTITVSGEGKVTVKPDMATVTMGAQATDLRAGEALRIVNEKTAALIAALKSAGVAEDDIATSGLNVWPNYDNSSRVSGFTASNSVTVKIKALDKAGSIIDSAATAAGDNVTISGIAFGVQDQEAVLGQARTAAIANAQKRAGEFAAAAGVKVGEVIQITEVGLSMPQPLVLERQAMDSTAGAAASVPVQAGTQDLTVNVTVQFLIG